MNFFGPRKRNWAQPEGKLVPSNRKPALRLKTMGWVFVLMFSSNFLTYEWTNQEKEGPIQTSSRTVSSIESKPLYLMERASVYVQDAISFEQKVLQLSQSLDIAPEWLMAVMCAESGFNPASKDVRTKGKVGLIQLSVPSVKQLNKRLGTKLYMKDIQKMPAHFQLDLIHEYLSMVQEKYGKIRSLTDCYLAIIHPKGIGQDYCYAISSEWTKNYTLFRQMDDNHDGIVSISDVDKQMRRAYPTAFLIDNSN